MAKVTQLSKLAESRLNSGLVDLVLNTTSPPLGRRGREAVKSDSCEGLGFLAENSFSSTPYSKEDGSPCQP